MVLRCCTGCALSQQWSTRKLPGCSVVAPKISDDPSDDVGSFSQHEPIWIGFTKEFENRQRHWDEVGRVSGLSSYPLQHSAPVPTVDSHEFQVLAMKSPAFHPHFFRRRLPGIVDS